MENRKETDNAIKAWSNKLEPDYLLSDFLRHPPVDFKATISEVGLPVFSALFDLTTTMDNEDQKRLKKIYHLIFPSFLSPFPFHTNTF